MVASTIKQSIVPPETVVETEGESAPFDLGSFDRRQIALVLNVVETIEQESLHVSIWGSEDGQKWSERALFWFPQVFYCGKTPAALDLSSLPGVRFLQARWEVFRWGRGNPRPRFKFSIDIGTLEP